jgi:rhomboid protease GluP
MVLIAINILVYIWEVATGALSTNAGIIQHGALWGPLIDRGEWWRIVTSAFLHGSVLHIAFNMFALFQVGTYLEALIGGPEMLLIYAISLVGSGFSVYKFAYNDVTVGASGAIFGIFGALVAIGLSIGPRGRALVYQTLPIIGINLVIGFSIPNISNAGHIGGLVSGFAAGFVLLAARRQFAVARVQQQLPGEEEPAAVAAAEAPAALATPPPNPEPETTQ